MDEQFVAQVNDAYEHLHDLVYLRSHPLLETLVLSPSLPGKKRARQLHRLLTDVIEELDPGADVPVFSYEWRRDRLMTLRYVKGLSPPAVADQLAMSVRHYYRVHRDVMNDVASVLWDRHLTQSAPTRRVPAVLTDESPMSRLELLRLETARMTQADRYARVEDVIEGVLSLLHNVLQQRALEVRLALRERLPGVLMDRGVLRQMLLSTMGYLIERARGAIIRLTAQADGPLVSICITVEPTTAVQSNDQQWEMSNQLGLLQEMATLGGARILPVSRGRSIVGFEVRVHTAERVVLVVDDNEDVLELFRSYLSPHRYRVVTAQTARNALALAGDLQPYAITLDLMLPGQDGWDLLQMLQTRQETQHIPIIVCTVLKQKELALSLGATAFLDKPVTEMSLLSVLDALQEA